MSHRIVIVDHPVGQRDDRATEILESWGFEIDWCRPAAGDALPPPEDGLAGAIVHGGAENLSQSHDVAYLDEELRWIRRWVEAGKPYAGFCLGGQLLAQAFGGRVGPHPQGLHEIGYVPVAPTREANGFLEQPTHMYQWHQEGFEPPPGAVLLATGEVYPNQAFRIGRDAYGLQFHPEVKPENFAGWIDEAGHMLERPGAHSRTRQLEDAKRCDGPMAAWLTRFLELWLGRPKARTAGLVQPSSAL